MKKKSNGTQAIGRLAYIARLFPAVKKVIDADETVMVEVKESDCTTAKSLVADECAFAHSVKRQFNADGAIVGLAQTYIIKGNTATRYKTGHTLGRELTSFDRHHDFAPGTYRLAKIDPSKRLGRQPPGRHMGARTGTKPHAHKTVRVRNIYAA